LAAMANPNLKVVSTDVSPFASQNTQQNAKQLGVQEQVKVYTGDVLESIPSTLKFDIIFWALPFGFLDPGTSTSLEDLQVFDPGYRSIRKFFRTTSNYLKPGGGDTFRLFFRPRSPRFT